MVIRGQRERGWVKMVKRDNFQLQGESSSEGSCCSMVVRVTYTALLTDLKLLRKVDP